MGYRLRDGVSFCETSGRLLFLDVRRDRYFCLTGPTEDAFRRLVRRQAKHGDAAHLAGCISDGLLLPAGDGMIPEPCVLAMPESSALDAPGHRHPASGIFGAVVRLASSELALRVFRLHGVLRGVARHKARTPGAVTVTPAMLAAPAQIFHAAALLASPLDRCLPRGIATTHRYLSLGIAVDLVLGVKLQPFAAHCWVQCGPVLLNDRIDTVRTFTPILVL